MKLKKVGAMVLALLMSLTIEASAKSISLNYSDGSSSRIIELSRITNVTVENDDIVVNLTGGSSITAPIASLSGINFTDKSSGVESTTADSKAVIVFGTSTAEISVGDGATALSVATPDGRQVLTTTVSGGQTVDLSGLESGRYILTVGKSNLKIVKQ